MADLIHHVPVNYSEAKTAREIWQDFGMYSDSYIANELGKLVDLGLIQRDRQIIPTGFQWRYWREASPS